MPEQSRREFIKSAMQLGAGVSLALSSNAMSQEPGSYDLIIENGLIYDGKGNAPFTGSIAIQSDKIVAVGDLKSHNARRTINAAGYAISPGFIDVHTHTDVELLVDNHAESKIRQGVTTEISGNCGDSVFPLSESSSANLRQEYENKYGIKLDWTDAAGFLERIRNKGIAFNYATLVGHGALRSAAVGSENRLATQRELEKMASLLEQAIDQGAMGLSTGLEYTPGSFADKNEIVYLCRIVAKRNGIYATHMRNEDATIESALEEQLEIARQSGVRLQISHFKVGHKRNWHKMPSLLERLERALADGIDLNLDRYPYTAYATSLRQMFPLWAREGENMEFINRIKNPTEWEKMRPFVVEKVTALGGWDRVLITSVQSPQLRSIQGKSVEILADEARQDPYLWVRDLLIAENGNVGMCGFAMSEENTEKVLTFPRTMVGSDGNAVAPYGVLGKGKPHPRYYGTFPRYLGYYVRDRKILSLTEAIRRITSLPADTFRLGHRGRIAAGCFADLVVFDPARIMDQATFTDPHQYPTGVDYVVVNGQLVIEKEKHSNTTPGRILAS
jgi:N-acyl-D-amino-acid deacylase